MTRELLTIEFVAFCLSEAPGVGAATLRNVLAKLAHEGLSPEDFCQLRDHELFARYGLKEAAIAALREPAKDTLETWQQLREHSVRLLVFTQPEYPQRLATLLRDNAPPLLFVLGNQEIFHRPAVGFCGSRKASEKGLAVAHDCARLFAEQQINVISGYAHGVDLATHRAAFEAGGTTTMVLAEGILQFRLKEPLRDVVSEGDFSRLLVVSEFPPGLPWRAHNAMARNRTICGLCHALIVIESGLEGGTFEAGKTALEIGEPLFCVEYAEPSPAAAGNPYFLQHGAFSIKRARTGQPNISRVLSVVRNGGLPLTAPRRQAELALREESH